VGANDVRDMTLVVSIDNVAAFVKPALMANDSWKISGCPQTGPQLVVKGKRLYAAWRSEGDGSNAGVRVAWSDDNGKTFFKPIIASGAVNDTNHPSLSLSEDGRLLLVFQEREPAEKEGWGPVRAFLMEIYDNGEVLAPSAIPGSRKTLQYAAVVEGTVGRVFVAWTAATDKGVEVMLSLRRKGPKGAISASGAASGKTPLTTPPASAEAKSWHQH
jgi:hypothetical protein